MAEIVIVADAAAAGAIVADEIARLVRANPEAVLGLATGSTPVPVYAALPSRLAGVDVSRVRGFALDEYVGLDPAHPESYRSVLTREVVEPLGLDPARVFVPNGSLDGIEHAGDDYERALAEAGGVDLQILGIGTDGHIGFNEPGSSLSSRTRLKTLARQTIDDNARFFKKREEVPIYAITMGVGTVLEAREIVLLANGKKKAEAIAAAVEGPVTSMITASALQLHPSTRVYLDEEAASQLKMREYFDWVQEKKPGAPQV